jgi:outer membrane protein OmpA-like peptidoglycan-associated protein
MQRYTIPALIALVFLSSPVLFSQTADTPVLLRFKYHTGDSFRILSTVSEEVKVNGVLNHHADIINRISVQVTDTNEQGSGYSDATFMASESSTGTQTGTHFTWGQEYESKFWRTPQGVYSIDDTYFMPVVRDVPLFPDTAVKPGDTWTKPGQEAHDLRQTFGITKPYHVPFVAQYTYLRNETAPSSGSPQEQKTFQVISVQYTLFYSSPAGDVPAEQADYPAETMGFSRQTIWWDNDKGQIDHYTEEFKIIIDTARGTRFDFSGTAHAEVTDFARTATEDTVKTVQDTVDALGLSDVSVEKSDKGLTISIQNIQFKPDSAELTESEKEKLQKIGQILSAYPDNDLLVTGHTALSGTEKARQELSEQRAASVAQFLTDQKIRDPYHVFTRGLGATVPIASNSTEEGKAKNRRVEITLLDK